jgi:hypothetical protein
MSLCWLALAGACEYREWLKRPKGIIPELESVAKKKAEQIVESALEQSTPRPLWLDATSVYLLTDC